MAFLTSIVSANTAARLVSSLASRSELATEPRATTVSRGAESSSSCEDWVGVEVIIVVDEIERCPDGQTG